MSTLVSTSDLIKELPTVRGNLQTNVPLANYTWFRTGGNAEILFTPEDPDDLVNFLNHCSQKTPAGAACWAARLHSFVSGECNWDAEPQGAEIA